MVYTCCVPNCSTGYKSSKNTEKVSLFRFPKTEEMKNKWIKAIPRQNWIVNDSHRVCAKHFVKEDIQMITSDTKRSKRNYVDAALKHVRLKKMAVPKIFPNLPRYLSKPSSTTRCTSATASFRLDLENKLIQQQNEKLLQKDYFDSFSSFKTNLKVAMLPKDFVQDICDETVSFHHLHYSKNSTLAPKLAISVIVSSELLVKVFVNSLLIPFSMYEHLLSCESLRSTTELANILAFCKSLLEKSDTTVDLNMQHLALAVSALQSFTSVLTTDVNKAFYLPLIQFMIEQLELIQVSKNGRRYSPHLITTSFLWQLTSTSLYKKLSDVFVLPSVRHLQTLSRGATVESGKIDLHYLKQRCSCLTDQERMVTLMIDEVYTAQRVEYSNGAFIGLTDEGIPSKTVLAFMVQSVCGKFKDVVCLIPVYKLDTKLLHTWFQKIMYALDDILFVIAVSVDNHVCNR